MVGVKPLPNFTSFQIPHYLKLSLFRELDKVVFSTTKRVNEIAGQICEIYHSKYYMIIL